MSKILHSSRKVKLQNSDMGLEKLQSIIYHLEVHVLTEARKRLEVLSTLSKSILNANIIENGSYKIEFQLDETSLNGQIISHSNESNLIFSSDASRIKVKFGTVYYGVKSSQSAIFKQKKPKLPERRLLFFNRMVDSNWRSAADDILDRLLDNKGITPEHRAVLESLQTNMREWDALDTWVNVQFLPLFVKDQKQLDKNISKLNGIIGEIWDEKTAVLESIKKQDSVIRGIKPPVWPIPNPDLIFPGYEQAGSIRQVSDFTNGYLSMIFHHHYKGTLSQTNYEGLHQAAIWLEKIIKEQKNLKLAVKYLTLVDEFQLIENEVRSYEKRIRAIPEILGSLEKSEPSKKSVEHAFRALCELQMCRLRAYSLLVEASKQVASTGNLELESVIGIFDKMAIRISASDPSVVLDLMTNLSAAQNPRVGPDFEESLLKYMEDLVVFSKKTDVARKSIADKKALLKPVIAKLERDFLGIVEKDIGSVSLIHAQIFIDEIGRIKAHSNFKQGIMIETDANMCLTPEKVLQTAISLMANGTLEAFTAKNKPGAPAQLPVQEVQQKLTELLAINGKIANDLASLGVRGKYDIDKARPYGHIEHNFEDIFPDYRDMLESNSTQKKIIVRYNEEVYRSQEPVAQHEVVVRLKSISDSPLPDQAVRLLPGIIKQNLAASIAESARTPFEDIVLGMPYDTKHIAADFGRQANDYLTYAMPWCESIITTDTLKAEFEQGGKDKRMVADVNEESTLHGVVLKIGQNTYENPAKLLERPNDAKINIESTADREVRADIEKYNILKKLIPLRNMVDMLHRKKSENISLSLADFKRKVLKQ